MGVTRAAGTEGDPGESHELERLLRARLSAPGAGLLLDLDGTLALSEPMHRRAYRRYFASRGWSVDDALLGAFAGRRAHEVFPVLDGPWRGEDPHALTSEVLAVLARMVAEGERPVEVPGAGRVLSAAVRAGLPAAVVTSARRDWADGVLAGLGAPADLPWVTAEDCTRGKPDPEPYRRGAAAIGLAARRLVAVEDAPAGIASAVAAGVGLVVGVTTSMEADVLRQAGAHGCVADLGTLAEVVEGLGRPPEEGGGAGP